MKKGTVTELLDHLYVMWPTVQITVELEKDGTLPLLDTQLQ